MSLRVADDPPADPPDTTPERPEPRSDEIRIMLRSRACFEYPRYGDVADEDVVPRRWTLPTLFEPLLEDREPVLPLETEPDRPLETDPVRLREETLDER